jgi:monoamine oxidase
LGYAQKDTFQIFGDSDERYRIKGGNDQLPLLLAKELRWQVHFHCELMKIKQSSKGEIKLAFRNHETEWEVKADKVILTVPFQILKIIDYKNAGFRPLKSQAIKELGMGVNTKLHTQFFSRHWREIGNNGETFADTGYQNTFESSRAQQGKSGILVGYLGGDTAAKNEALTEEQVKEVTKNFLDKLEPVLPKSNSNWNGLSTLDHWLSNQWSKGSYSYRKVGQFTQYAGIEGEREGNIFFAGEHTSVYYQGYLNGAVETGERAAREVMIDLGFHK